MPSDTSQNLAATAAAEPPLEPPGTLDLSTGLMTVLNVCALFLLTKVIVSLAKNYHEQHLMGQLPEYKPDESEHEKFHLTKGIWQKESKF